MHYAAAKREWIVSRSGIATKLVRRGLMGLRLN